MTIHIPGPADEDLGGFGNAAFDAAARDRRADRGVIEASNAYFAALRAGKSPREAIRLADEAFEREVNR